MPKFYHYEVEPLKKQRTFSTKSSQVIEKEDNGIVCRVVQEMEIEPSKVNEGLTAADFSLDVLIRNNAVDLLKESSPIKQSNLRVASTVEQFTN